MSSQVEKAAFTRPPNGGTAADPVLDQLVVTGGLRGCLQDANTNRTGAVVPGEGQA